MTNQKYNKTALTPQIILDKLQAKGMALGSTAPEQALAYLQYTGPYRFKGYWYHLENKATKSFPVGTTFTEVIHRYECDRELRILTLEAIERLEVAIRVVMTNYLSLKHQPHWYLSPDIFKPTRDWGIGQLIRKIEEEVSRAKDRLFIEKYYQTYEEPYLPPAWAICECVTFGFWSQTYKVLRDPHDKKAISSKFKVSQHEVFESWLHALTILRNIVAHHSRLLRVKLKIAPANYKSMGVKFADNKTFYAAATVINILLSATGLPQTWKADLLAIFSRYPSVNPATELGFSPGWHNAAGW